MQHLLSHYIMLTKRWVWIIILGVAICGGGTYVVSKFIHPVYQASTTLVINLCTTQSSAYDCTSAGLAALPTYTQLITSPTVLNPVVAKHRGLTPGQLTSMIIVKPLSGTQLIELDVENTNPQLAMQLANEVSQSFAQFSNTQLQGTVQVLPATLPTDPVRPKPLTNALIGALVGLGLALALIILFEWIDDRPARSEAVQDLLGVDTLAIIPELMRKQRDKNTEELPALAEKYRMLCTNLNAIQAIKPCKLVMVTSALAHEGKSTIASNLATFLAMTNKRVLLVDADLRHPALDQHFHLDNRYGLSRALLETWPQIEVELDGQPTDIPTLRVLTAGVPPLNPADLLQSQQANRIFDHFSKTTEFDYVIFDTPPLLPVADAQILATHIQAILLIVDVSKTPRKVLLRTKALLSRINTRLLGIVINKSYWRDYGDIRDYLNNLHQQRPNTPETMSIPPHTPPLNGLADHVNGLADHVNGLADHDTLILARHDNGDE